MVQFSKDYPGGFIDGPTGGTPITAQVENNIEQGIADEDVRNPSSPASVALNGLYGHDVRAWAPNTQYAAAQAVVSPSGDVVTAKAAFTSGATFDPTKWNLSATFEPAGLSAATKATVVQPWAANTAYAAGQPVVSPSGDVVTAATAHTSGATYSGLVSAGGNWNVSTTFAANTYPGKQTFDTLDAQALRYWRIALANRNSAPANIFHLGDSVTWGYMSAATPSLAGRWPSILRDTLRSRFPNTTPVVGGFGYYGAVQTYSGVTMSDATVVTTGGTVNTQYGLDMHTVVLAAAGDNQHYTFTGTGVDLFYAIYNAGGTFSYSVDGGAATQVNTLNATKQNAARTQIRGLTAGSHTLDITYVSGGGVFFEGIAVYNGDEAAGIRSWVGAWPGSATTDWLSTAGGGPFWYEHMPNIQPALVTIELGLNDLAYTPIATFTSNMQTIISRIKAKCGYVPSIVLTPTWPQTRTSPPDPWSSFVAAMYQIAASDPDGAVCVFDWQARTTSVPGTTAGGLLDPTDKVHLTPLGNRYIAEAFAQFLAPR